MEEIRALSPEILEGIKPFSGDPTEMLPAERLLRNGFTLQKVGTQYATAVAVQKRRSLPTVVSNVLEEAELAGEAFYYGWNVTTKQGKRWIQGGSISLATSIARNWGNSVVDADLVEETPTHHILKGYFIDLETGVTFGRPFRQRKQPNIGMGDDIDRKEDISFQIGLSKASRNAIFEGVPRWLVDRAIDRAQQAVKKGLGENLEIARAEAIKYFKRYGVGQERIENALGTPADNWTPEHLVELKGMATALKEGRVTTDELFPKDVGPTAPPPKEKQKRTRKTKATPPLKAEDAATGQNTLPGGDSEGETEPLADDDEKYPIKCTNKEVAADRVYADYCEGRCRFREKADGSVCEDYLNYVDELTGRE